MSGSRRVSLFVLLLAGAACQSPRATPSGATGEAGVRAMLAALQVDLEREGPAGWMAYFAEDPAFFMASEGRLLFPDRAAAAEMVAAFDPRVAHMQLWLDDVRVELLDARRAVVAAAYREVILDVDEHETPMRGYLTALVELVDGAWRFRNLHWSSPLDGGGAAR
jgi:hypothetical protein